MSQAHQGGIPDSTQLRSIYPGDVVEFSASSPNLTAFKEKLRSCETGDIILFCDPSVKQANVCWTHFGVLYVQRERESKHVNLSTGAFGSKYLLLEAAFDQARFFTISDLEVRAETFLTYHEQNKGVMGIRKLNGERTKESLKALESRVTQLLKTDKPVTSEAVVLDVLKHMGIVSPSGDSGKQKKRKRELILSRAAFAEVLAVNFSCSQDIVYKGAILEDIAGTFRDGNQSITISPTGDLSFDLAALASDAPFYCREDGSSGAPPVDEESPDHGKRRKRRRRKRSAEEEAAKSRGSRAPSVATAAVVRTERDRFTLTDGTEILAKFERNVCTEVNVLSTPTKVQTKKPFMADAAVFSPVAGIFHCKDSKETLSVFCDGRIVCRCGGKVKLRGELMRSPSWSFLKVKENDIYFTMEWKGEVCVALWSGDNSRRYASEKEPFVDLAGEFRDGDQQLHLSLEGIVFVKASGEQDDVSALLSLPQKLTRVSESVLRLPRGELLSIENDPGAPLAIAVMGGKRRFVRPRGGW